MLVCESNKVHGKTKSIPNKTVHSSLLNPPRATVEPQLWHIPPLHIRFVTIGAHVVLPFLSSLLPLELQFWPGYMNMNNMQSD